jgi:hypothetical protein
MNTWMIFFSVWAMSALCVVLFIRGAHPHVERSPGERRDDNRDLTRGAMAVARVHGADTAS